MMYELIYAKKFFKQLKKLNREIQKRILLSLERIRIRPFHFIRKLVGLPYFKLRVGDYRVILKIDERNKKILLLYVGHRKEMYK